MLDITCLEVIHVLEVIVGFVWLCCAFIGGKGFCSIWLEETSGAIVFYVFQVAEFVVGLVHYKFYK